MLLIIVAASFLSQLGLVYVPFMQTIARDPSRVRAFAQPEGDIRDRDGGACTMDEGITII
jgi:hypothetical protein